MERGKLLRQGWDSSGHIDHNPPSPCHDDAPRPIDAAQIDPAYWSRSIFETAAYREAYGIESPLRVEITGGDTPGPLLFDDCGDHAICLARAATLDATAIRAASAALFAEERIRFIVFEDVRVDQPVDLRPAPLRFDHQGDWVMQLGDPAGGIHRSLRRQSNRKLRRLESQHDGIRLEIIASPPREIVEEAVRLSRRKFEANGRTYMIDEKEKERLVRFFARIGTASVLYHGERVVSADLFAEHGREVFAFFGGYDTAYARASPGTITIRYGIEHFAARGFERAHLLWGDGAYKASFGAVKIPLSTLIVPRDRKALLNARLVMQAAELALLEARRRIREVPWLGDVLRRALHRFRSLKAKVFNRA